MESRREPALGFVYLKAVCFDQTESQVIKIPEWSRCSVLISPVCVHTLHWVWLSLWLAPVVCSSLNSELNCDISTCNVCMMPDVQVSLFSAQHMIGGPQTKHPDFHSRLLQTFFFQSCISGEEIQESNLHFLTLFISWVQEINYSCTIFSLYCMMIFHSQILLEKQQQLIHSTENSMCSQLCNHIL